MVDEVPVTEQFLPERLAVIEQAGVYLVVNEDDPSDWVACFTEDERFPARDWAERMAELYNLRGHETRDPSRPPIFTGTHHPQREYPAEANDE